jgi:hypothetical protein
MESTIVEVEFMDFPSEVSPLTFFSQLEIASRVSWRRDWWRMTSQQGRKTVKISIEIIERQIH